KDKKLRASVAVTLFDKLIENSLKNTNPANIPEIVGKTWEKIYEGTLDPSIFLEDEKVIKKRLKRLVNRFGVDRVPYSGPECGLGGFPEYNLAINYLKRISKAIKNFKPNSY
ncbi:MAG: hypothetical protein GWN17_04750, partial [Candidatus Korarchaeota archaeon]|nr:hypothetical protein [Candidatus Korarchaeota archaeon]